MGSASGFPRIKEVRTFIIDGVGSGGDYHNVSDSGVLFELEDNGHGIFRLRVATG